MDLLGLGYSRPGYPLPSINVTVAEVISLHGEIVDREYLGDDHDG